MSKIHRKSQSERPLWGMKVSQQREDQIYFIAWLKSIWCVRCWGLKGGMSNGRLLSISSFLTIEWVRCQGESWLRQLHDSMIHDMWHWGKKKKKKQWKGHQMRPVMQNRWLKDYEATVLTWRGNDRSHLKTNNPSCFTPNARSNSLNPISCFHSSFNSAVTLLHWKKKTGNEGLFNLQINVRYTQLILFCFQTHFRHVEFI